MLEFCLIWHTACSMMVTRLVQETFGHRADDTSFCFVVYPGVIFCECGQVELFLLLLLGFSFFPLVSWWGGGGLKP